MLIVYLKHNHLIYIDDQKNNWDNTVVDYKLPEGAWKRANKREPMTIGDIASNVESHRKPSREKTHPEKAHEVYLIEIFWIEEQIGNAKVFTKISRHHGKKHHPANHQHNVSSEIVKQKLHGKRIDKLRPEKV